MSDQTTQQGICAKAWGVDQAECDRTPCECVWIANQVKMLRAEFDYWKVCVRTHVEGY